MEHVAVDWNFSCKSDAFLLFLQSQLKVEFVAFCLYVCIYLIPFSFLNSQIFIMFFQNKIEPDLFVWTRNIKVIFWYCMKCTQQKSTTATNICLHSKMRKYCIFMLDITIPRAIYIRTKKCIESKESERLKRNRLQQQQKNLN